MVVGPDAEVPAQRRVSVACSVERRRCLGPQARQKTARDRFWASWGALGAYPRPLHLPHHRCYSGMHGGAHGLRGTSTLHLHAVLSLLLAHPSALRVAVRPRLF